MSRLRRVVVWLGLISISLWNATAQAEDWPQWQGPQRDSVWRETGVIKKFPEAGPEILWRTNIGLGFSGPAVVGDKVFVFDYLHDGGDLTPSASVRNRLIGQERIACLDAKTGEQLWEYKYDCPYFISYPSGPRCTPTVHEGFVYTVGAEGNLTCLNAKNGKKIWAKSLKEQYPLEETPIWGYSSHPLVDGDLLYCLAGGEGSVVVAFNRKTGEEVWKNLSSPQPGYSPPTMIEHGGTKQLIVWDPESLNSLNPIDGTLHWSQPLKPDYTMSVMSPRLSGDYLYAAGIGDVGAVFKLGTDANGQPMSEEVWRGTGRTGIYPGNSTPFIEDGVIFGCNIRPGSYMAADLLTGERLWETTELISGERPAAHATAFTVKNGNQFILFTEKGDLVITKLGRNGFREISRAHVIEPTGDAFGRPVVWTHPAYANKCCYVRNDNEIICVNLAE
ncbi:outer membrane protein assembly factor BamB family protein [Rubinisphaera italica]|uniref:Outer membrane protein assembly factor BamB n=1 Tax=Rubinisphaera italica TaxID=2527969 RepID=A0A5C5XPM5_9PLAN|nr:PQQ-binding-like beta-propeller repeat protein [Rubinisphaera italica]TWT64421.1 Outer membrane protein assembly factor BamB precursor [Rubinisphaera italica]